MKVSARVRRERPLVREGREVLQREPPKTRWMFGAGLWASPWASSSLRWASRIPSTASRGAREGSPRVASAAPRVCAVPGEMDRARGELRKDRVTLREFPPRLRTASLRMAGASRGSKRASQVSSSASDGLLRASRSLRRVAQASSRASVRASGAAIGADKEGAPNGQGICRIEWSVHPHAERRSPKNLSVDTKTTGSLASFEGCCPKTESIPAHDDGSRPCVPGSPTSADSFRRSSGSIPTSS
jgi:hypothetical protein